MRTSAVASERWKRSRSAGAAWSRSGTSSISCTDRVPPPRSRADMPASHPPAADLLGVVIEFLEGRILPGLEGDRRFHCRVAINVLATVKREIELGPALDTAERERLVHLLGDDGPLDALNAELARRIREGTLGDERDELVEHLRTSIAGALRINNPKWIDDPS